jgi:hypothetical protein
VPSAGSGLAERAAFVLGPENLIKNAKDLEEGNPTGQASARKGAGQPAEPEFLLK